MKAIKYIIILVASVFIFNACTKQVQGPTGPAGAQGQQGAAASYSVTIDSIDPVANPSIWQSVGNNEYQTTINNVKALSNPNFCIVEVYYSNLYNQAATWTELAASDVFSNPADLLTFSYYTNVVTLDYFNPANTSPPSKIYIKIVIINQP